MQHGFARGECGLTLMELIIVLAVIAIIGAILAPNFVSATDRTRLKSDIQSSRIIQTAIETYNAERSSPISTTDSVATILTTLRNKGYLSNANGSIPQTDGAVWVYNGNVVLDITGCGPNIRGDIYRALSTEERDVIVGGTP